MNFNQHSDLEGCHAFLSPSKFHWINYDEDKLYHAYITNKAAEEGTILHDFARQCILLRQRLDEVPKTLNMYVNDAIAYKMRPEQVLYYSDHCFGSADAICFRHNKLRIHDLKTGKGPTHMEQLEIYTALFCLEYDVNINDIEVELRIYQNDKIKIHIPTVDEIVPIMDAIVTGSKLVEEWENGIYE